MINLNLITCDAPPVDGKLLFDVKYGDAIVTHVRAKNEDEAKERLLFVLMYYLRGVTLDYEPDKIEQYYSRPRHSAEERKKE